MLRASMQVLIKIIQKRGASSFVWRCGTGSFGGLASFPHPCALRRFSLVSTFYCWAARLHLCTSTSGEATGSKRIERHSAHFFLSHLPSLHPCHPKPSRLSLTGEVINFIYTLIRLSDEGLPLWIVGVKGLWDPQSGRCWDSHVWLSLNWGTGRIDLEPFLHTSTYSSQMATYLCVTICLSHV